MARRGEERRRGRRDEAVDMRPAFAPKSIITRTSKRVQRTLRCMWRLLDAGESAPREEEGAGGANDGEYRGRIFRGVDATIAWARTGAKKRRAMPMIRRGAFFIGGPQLGRYGLLGLVSMKSGAGSGVWNGSPRGWRGADLSVTQLRDVPAPK